MPAGDRGRIPLGYKLFFRESLKSLASTASVLPSSRFLSGALLDPLDFGKLQNIVELGCGTGAVTREILKRLPSHARVLALDTNANFIGHLRSNCRDERLIPVHTSAEELTHVLSRLRVKHVDAVVSSLGLTSMGPAARTCILRQVCHTLAPGGIMTQYQYGWASAGSFTSFPFRRFHEGRFLRLFFRQVDTRHVLLNLPPAVVFVCRK